nr:mechanosensitive ion channel family protein [uncultured Duganella sp.]
MWPLITMTLAALLWLLTGALGAGAPEPSLLSYRWLHLLTLALSALAAVQIAHRLLSFGLQRAKGAVGTATSDLLRAVVGIALYLVAGVLFLRHGLDLDISNVVLTSAALSVIIGLALQPLLGHLFAGVSVELERTVRVGDHVRRDDLEGRVVSLSWRSVRLVTIRRSYLVIPNSDFTSRAIEVIPAEVPYRHDVLFSVDASTSPGVVLRLATQVLRSGLADTCSPHEASVLLLGNDNRAGTINYAARFFTLNFLTRRVAASQFLERFWYALSRDGLQYPMHSRQKDAVTEADRAALPGVGAALEQALVDGGRRQHYARREKLGGDGVALVLQGMPQLTSKPDQRHDDAALRVLMAELSTLGGKPAPSRLAPEQRAALLNDAKLVLGPLAHPLCERIAALTEDPSLAYRALAQSCPEPAQRAALLAKAPPHSVRSLRKGDWLGWTQALGLSPALEAHAGDDGCELFTWSTPELRAALASATSDDLRQIVERAQAGASTGEPFSLAQLEDWLRAAAPAIEPPARRADQ